VGTVKRDVISGKYRLVRLLGEGGAGNVWEAENLLVGRRVAIKILHPTIATRPDAHQRFLAEARLSARLAHPNVVDVYDLGRTDEGSPYIVMELLAGETLEGMLKRRGRVPAPFACELMLQVLGTLEAAHRLDIVHRDLKPANVMLVYTRPEEPLVKVLDFGVAQGLHAEAIASDDGGLLFGTLEYMAPEQATGSQVDARCDLYATGAILYELITGQPPITGNSPTVVLSRLLVGTPRPLHKLAPEVDRDLEAIVMLALSKSVELRPQSANEMSKMLRRFTGQRHSDPRIQLSAHPIMLTQKKRSPNIKKTLQLVVQSSVPPARRSTRAPGRRTTMGFSKAPKRG